MKKNLLSAVLLALLSIFYGCTTEEQNVTPRTALSFQVAVPNEALGGRTKSGISDARKVLISLETSTGESILTLHPVNILSFGSGYVTEPLQVAVGSYRLTDFLVVDESQNVLYATPKKGSSLADYVARPLPYNFSAANGKASTIDMQVIEAGENAPEAFGYTSFGVTVVNPLAVSVFVPEEGKLLLASAKAFVIDGTDTVGTYTLGAKINKFGFKQDPAATYTLVVIKDGYERYSESFTYNALSSTTPSLAVTLKPALTLWVTQNIYDSGGPELNFELGVTEQTVFTVNWGDGTTSQLTTEDNIGDFFHSYAIDAPHSYFVTVTTDTDLSSISSISNYPFTVRTYKTEHKNLTDLKTVGYKFHAPSITDLSKNSTIEEVFINRGKIILPEQHNIRYFNMSGGMTLAPQLDYIIDSIYKNALSDNRKNGYFNFSKDWNGDVNVMLGTPSFESVQKLTTLRNYYGWTIFPNI